MYSGVTARLIERYGGGRTQYGVQICINHNDYYYYFDDHASAATGGARARRYVPSPCDTCSTNNGVFKPLLDTRPNYYAFCIFKHIAIESVTLVSFTRAHVRCL